MSVFFFYLFCVAFKPALEAQFFHLLLSRFYSDNELLAPGARSHLDFLP